MKSIFINFNIFEGEKYSISDVEVVGDVPIEDEVYIRQLLDSLKRSNILSGSNNIYRRVFY